MKIIYRYIILLVFLSVSFSSQAQDINESEGTLDDDQPVVALKIAPLSLMDYTPSIQGAIEVKLAQNVGFQTEFGYISTFGQVEHWLHSSEIELQGFRLKNELRFYLSSTPGGGFYIGPEVFYKKVDETWDEDVSRYSGLYTEIVEVKETKKVIGSHIKLGTQHQIFDTGLLIDLYGGFGIRYLNIESNEPDDDTYFYSYDWFDRVDGSYILPSLSLGLKLGYKF